MQQAQQAASDGVAKAEAPPKQVAMAMERLALAGRLIADVRLGADRLLEALFVAASEPHSSSKSLNLVCKEEASMREHLQNLRTIGKQLEDSGVLSESLRSRSNSWGLHMPLVCPDGAVVAYAWKRQLAGQAGASAVDRTRLALKAFNDQKKRFFPHLDNNSDTESPSKKQRVPQTNDEKTLSDILINLEKEIPDVKTSTYQRLDWLKRATILPSLTNETSSSNDRTTFHTNKPRQGLSQDKIGVIELLFPCVLRAVISLHPAGSINPDAVSFFSPDEGGSYVHARGISVNHAFKQITEHAAMALQYFVSVNSETALKSLLYWVCSYRSLLTTSCSKCGKRLSMDKQSALLLSPVIRPYRDSYSSKSLVSEGQDILGAFNQAYHIDCFQDGA